MDQDKYNIANLYNKKGNSLAKSGKYKEALQAYKKSLNYLPDNAATYNNIGNCLATLGYHKEALQAYKKANDINPEYAPTYYNTGNYFVKLGKLKEAYQLFSIAIQIKPDYTLAINKQIKINQILPDDTSFLDTVLIPDDLNTHSVTIGESSNT